MAPLLCGGLRLMWSHLFLLLLSLLLLVADPDHHRDRRQEPTAYALFQEVYGFSL